MRRRDVLRGSAALAGTLALAGGPPIPTFAQASMTLKVSDVHAPGYPTVAAVESLGKKLEQATNGRLTVQMFGSMQLGGDGRIAGSMDVRHFQRHARLRESGDLRTAGKCQRAGQSCTAAKNITSAHRLPP